MANPLLGPPHPAKTYVPMTPTPVSSFPKTRLDLVLDALLPWLERHPLASMPPKVRAAVTEFLAFGLMQAWACLFGGLLLAAIIVTGLWWPDDAPLARYDFLFGFAVLVQLMLLVTRLERPAEAVVVGLFHVVGTAMEVFKTAAGSWIYPEESLLVVGNVPLFSGFMYAAVGSYLARVIRTCHLRFRSYPPMGWTILVAVCIYANFFSHHYLPDARYLLMVWLAVLFGRTRVCFQIWRWRFGMPMLAGFFLVAIFIWGAENIATLSQIWLYPDQEGAWRPVSIAKLGAWFLLMVISWVLVTLVHRPGPMAKDQPDTGILSISRVLPNITAAKSRTDA